MCVAKHASSKGLRARSMIGRRIGGSLPAALLAIDAEND
jgi:hypothetical protein